MHTGSIFTIFLLIFLNFNFAFSSPTINIVEIQVKENDPFCLNSDKKNTTTINYESDYIPKTDEIELNEDWIFYIFDGLVAMSIGAILSLILRDLLLIFFEEEIRMHGITIEHELIIANEFAYIKAERQLQYYLNDNNNSFERTTKQSRATAFVTQARR
uniref:Uncharacterized protein n=1 Tax=Panagrolaimus davidi TaxID=227884 RepID=A0A914PFC9_9BILA